MVNIQMSAMLIRLTAPCVCVNVLLVCVEEELIVSSHLSCTVYDQMQLPPWCFCMQSHGLFCAGSSGLGSVAVPLDCSTLSPLAAVFCSFVMAQSG